MVRLQGTTRSNNSLFIGKRGATQGKHIVFWFASGLDVPTFEPGAEYDVTITRRLEEAPVGELREGHMDDYIDVS